MGQLLSCSRSCPQITLALYSCTECLCILLYKIIQMPNFQIINIKIFFLCLSSCLVHHYQWTEQDIAKVCFSPRILGLDGSCFGRVTLSKLTEGWMTSQMRCTASRHLLKNLNKCNKSAVVIAFPIMITYHSMNWSENFARYVYQATLKIGVPIEMLSVP